MKNIIKTITELGYSVKILNYDVTGERLSIVDQGNNVILWDLAKNTSVELPDKLGNITSSEFSPLGTHLIIISDDNGVNFFDPITLKISYPRFNPAGNIHFATFNGNEELLLISVTAQGGVSAGLTTGLMTLKFVDSTERFISSEMSSTWPYDWPTDNLGRKSNQWHGPKELAFDGDETTMVHNDPQTDKDPFWIGQLETSSSIKLIHIINRQWGTREQMANYLISILDENKKVVWEKRYLDTYDKNYIPPTSLSCKIDGDIVGKYIKIQCYANNHNQGGKIISFAEIYVYSGKGYYHLKNEELFKLTKVINPYQLNEKGALEKKTLSELNYNLTAISDKPFFKKMRKQNASPNKLYDSLIERYNNKNWPSFISTYDYLVQRYNYSMKNYLEVLYANALLEQNKYDRAFSIYSDNVTKLKQNEQANLILLSSQKKNVVNDLREKINIDELILEHPEVSIFRSGENAGLLDRAIQNIDKKLPSYYAVDIQLSEKFYQSFILELEIENTSDGEILSMGGKDYSDGFSLWKQGNWIRFIITNSETGETKTAHINLWNVLRLKESKWLKHHITWDYNKKNLTYKIDGINVGSVDFEGPLGNQHSLLTVGGDPINHNYGNLKISSLKIWDKEIGEEQTTNTNSIGDPIYELTPEQLDIKGRPFNVILATDEPTLDAYGEILNSEITFMQIKNDGNKSKLFINYLIKSTLELLNKNYGESAKYLKFTFELKQSGKLDQLQLYIGSSLLQEIDDPELVAYMEHNQEANSTNWKLRYILNKLIENEKQ